jgi:hypothetical protein
MSDTNNDAALDRDQLLLLASVLPPFPLALVASLIWIDSTSLPGPSITSPTTIPIFQTFYAIWIIMLMYLHHPPTAKVSFDGLPVQVKHSMVRREHIGKCISVDIMLWFLWWAWWDYHCASRNSPSMTAHKPDSVAVLLILIPVSCIAIHLALPSLAGVRWIISTNVPSKHLLLPPESPVVPA